MQVCASFSANVRKFLRHLYFIFNAAYILFYFTHAGGFTSLQIRPRARVNRDFHTMCVCVCVLIDSVHADVLRPTSQTHRVTASIVADELRLILKLHSHRMRCIALRCGDAYGNAPGVNERSCSSGFTHRISFTKTMHCESHCSRGVVICLTKL